MPGDAGRRPGHDQRPGHRGRHPAAARPGYRETIARIQEGAIGEIVYAKCYWNGGQIWVIDREPGLERHGVAAAQLELLSHEHLIASILAGSPINEAQATAESTLTGIMGREAAYSGQAVTWEPAMASERRLGPERYALGRCRCRRVHMPGQCRFE